jgi:SAM-dependent methyltransferase
MNKLDKFQRDWDDLAKIDPMWAICSDPAMQHGKWNADDFFETGRRQIQQTLTALNDLDATPDKGTALDFGCGIGRLTQALAEEFDRVYGVDISPEMIERAGQFNRFPEKCIYVLHTRNDLQIFDTGIFDFIYTYIVLQHMPPDLMLGYLGEFVRILRPGGILVFQVPIQRLEYDAKKIHLISLPRYHPERVMNKLVGILLGHNLADRYYRLRRLGIPKAWLYERFGLRPEIQMHTLDEAVITRLMVDQGMKVVHIQKWEDEASKMVSAEFVVAKPT